MDSAYLSAFAALAGSAIGSMTTLAASWLTQRHQFAAQQLAHDIGRREELYKEFIEEASACYADAFAHEEEDAAKLVRLYALVSRMRVLSSSAVIEQADNVMRLIIETYASPNRPFRDILQRMEGGTLNPLQDFSEVCRSELATGVVVPKLTAVPHLSRTTGRSMRTRLLAVAFGAGLLLASCAVPEQLSVDGVMSVTGLNVMTRPDPGEPAATRGEAYP